MTKNKHLLPAIYPAILLYMNAAAFFFGIIYLLRPRETFIWNIFGYLMLITLFGNIGLSVWKESPVIPGRLYLFLSAAFMSGVFILNTLVSIDPENFSSQSRIAHGLILALFGLGGIMAYQSHVNPIPSNNGLAEEKKTGNSMAQIPKNIAIILLSAILYFGLYLAVNLLKVSKVGTLEPFISEYALFLAVIFLSIGVLIVQLLDKAKYYFYYSIVLTVTIFIFLVFLLPLAFLPATLKNAENDFAAAFGDEYKANPIFKGNQYRQLPFSMAEYFFGIPSNHYLLTKDVVFYEGMEGVDQGLKLAFDVYTPSQGQQVNGYPVLIRIHGGAWTSGDKGERNFSQMNKYYAAQGYAVFDIEYGLNDKINWLKMNPTEKSRSGNFTIDDMVRHIGLFTKYLVQHQKEYRVNLNQVFVSGGSAGGQLAMAAGLGMASGNYQKILDSQIQIRGIIPFYPANGISTVFEINGRQELVDPILLIDKSSPPCLIYQGSHDGLVDKEIAEDIRLAYLDDGNGLCAVIRMPFGGHASDLYFSGYYNQIFVYYMERFLYQYQ